jgi:hypothetical protein
MSEEQKLYHELETMQEYGYLEEGTNIAEALEQYIEDNLEEETEDTYEELENHMVIGEYYGGSNE